MNWMRILVAIINLSIYQTGCTHILAFYWYLLTQRDDLHELEACLHKNVISGEVSLSILPDFFQIFQSIEMLIFYLYKMD